MANYPALVGSGAAFAGFDQGIDFTGGGFDVFALGDAVITRVQRGGSGWPGEGAVLNYKLLSGPKAGSYVYVAEDFAPRSDLVAGKVVRKGESLGRATGSGKAPGIEIGWAQPSGIPVAPRPAPRPANQVTSQGLDFGLFAAGGSAASGGPKSGAPSLAKQVPGVKQAADAVDSALSVGKFLGRLTDASYLLRGLQIIAGAVLVLAGVVLLTRQVALAADLPDPVAGAAGRVSRVPLPGTDFDLYQR